MNRLGLHLFLTVTVVVLSITAAYEFLRLLRERRDVLVQLEREAGLVARAVEGPLEFWMRTGRRHELERLLRDIREAKGATCVGVYDASERLEIASADEAHVATAKGCPGILERGMATKHLWSRWDTYGTFRIQAPLAQDSTRIGTLKLVFPASTVMEPIRHRRNVLIAERAVVLVAIGVTLWLAIALFVSRPIRRLMRGVEEIGRGNLGTRIDVKARAEVGDLARAFNRMAENLREAERRRQAEEERRMALEHHVRHADKLAAIGQLASQFAHDIGTPLNVISGRARVLRREIAEGNARVENLDIIRNQVDRISRVINRLLTVARPSKMQRERIDLYPLVREVAAFVTPEVRKRQARLILSGQPHLPAVVADPDGVFQVLLNLIMNALAAVSPGGRIEVALSYATAQPTSHGAGAPAGSGGIEIRVTDDGEGIVPEILPRVFEPFFSTRPGEGTGLGLSICRDIIRDHGGWIGADSQPGEGTTVCFWLPVASEDTTDGSPAGADH